MIGNSRDIYASSGGDRIVGVQVEIAIGRVYEQRIAGLGVIVLSGGRLPAAERGVG